MPSVTASVRLEVPSFPKIEGDMKVYRVLRDAERECNFAIAQTCRHHSQALSFPESVLHHPVQVQSYLPKAATIPASTSLLTTCAND
jgi:hypothetical protein